MSDATTGSAQANARVSTMPKLSPPSDGRDSAFAERSRSVSSSWGRKPRISIPSSGTRSRVSRRRTASGSAPQIFKRRTGSRPDLRPGAEQHLETLARLLPAGEDDRVLPPAGSASSGIRTPFGITS